MLRFLTLVALVAAAPLSMSVQADHVVAATAAAGSGIYVSNAHGGCYVRIAITFDARTGDADMTAAGPCGMQKATWSHCEGTAHGDIACSDLPHQPGASLTVAADGTLAFERWNCSNYSFSCYPIARIDGTVVRNSADV